MTAAASPDSGRIENGEHHFRLRVYYEDTDAGGIVYHSNYLKYAERARTEMLRLTGIGQRDLLARDGLAFAVRSLSIDFLRPARLDDELAVRSRLTERGAASMTILQRIVRADGQSGDEEDLTLLTVRVACVRTDGRPTRIPAEVREGFAVFAPEAEF
ncbi:MAG: tol-pal system-associated acyl-CoA thioesterase [Rhodovibrionaceae bacterium]|nr:tol-pal system-associated acyl-CoA thioesterase [Rhodovibrionaceae bacterium]